MAAKTKQRRKGKTAARGRTRPPQAAGTPDPRAAEAARLQGGGEHDRANKLWHAILQDRPDDLTALQHLGVLQLQQPDGDTDLADRLLGRAAELLPQSAPAAMHHGLALQRAGRHADAETALRRALALKPDYAEAYNNLGVSLVSQGRIQEAGEAFRCALAHAPDHAAAKRNLDGLAAYSDDEWRLTQKAKGLLELERYAEAAEVYRQLLAKTEDPVETRVRLADCLRRSMQHEAAIAELEAILDADPNRSDVRTALATVLYERARYREALAQIECIDPLDDVYERTHHLRANVLRYLRDYDAATEAYNAAIEYSPDDAKVRNDYGLMLSAMNRTTDASVELLRAVTLDPGNWHTYNNLGNVLKDQGRTLDALELYESALSKCGRNPMLHSNMLLTLNYVAGLSREGVFEGHRKFQECLDHITPQRVHPNDPTPERRLRVGYVSSDFRAHSVACFFEPLLCDHDRTKVEIFLYANVTNPDDVTERMQAQADHWRDVRNRPSETIADLIRRDAIDVLVDMNGHTGSNLLDVFHHKPAPVQVSWLGYPNTTGLDTVDYRIVDAITEPAGDAEKTSTERIVRLPGGFHCFELADNRDVEIAPPPVHGNGFVRFGSFNYLAKISEDVIRIWARILTQVPDSRLLMKARGLGDTLSNRAYLALFEKYGVARERIDIVSYQPSQRDHLQLYGSVDIALDTFPYNGTTTTCEALWMGVPVVALLGDAHAGRVSASLLTHMGAPELVARDVDEYVERAVALAGDRSALDRYRASLRPMFEASPLQDAPGFAGKFEAALREMWRSWCADGAQGAPDHASTGTASRVTEPARAVRPDAEDVPDTIRVLHHLARTGGTLISKCLGAMDGVALLSEAHPQGLRWIDPIKQAQQWYGLIDAREAAAIRTDAAPFQALIELTAARCKARGWTLLVRDWTHLDFTGVPFVRPSFQLRTVQTLSASFDSVANTATVRHPIDEWLSLDRLSVIHGRLSLADYLRGYRKFAEAVQDIGFVRYEDFTHDPDGTLQRLCDRLRLPFDAGYRDRWAAYDRITGDVSRNGPPQTEIRPVRPKSYDPELLSEFRASPDFQPALDLLGYVPDSSLPTSLAPAALAD